MTGPLPADDEGPPTPSEAASAKRDDVPTKPPPPVRRQTMEVQMAWLDLRPDEPRIEQVVTTEATPKTQSVSPISDALQSDTGDIADAFPENEAATVPRRWPPRLPGATRSLPPMPVSPTKPPPPPRRMTTEVKMEWVELVDDDLVEEPPSAEAPVLPKVHDDEGDSRELTRLELAGVVSERIENERAAALAEGQAEELEGPPISQTVRDSRLAEEAAKKERLSQFLQATSGSVPPGALSVSEIPPASSDADHDRMREDALAARKREQDERDRKILERRRAARERERVEEEARQALREHSKREEEERLAAIRHGVPDGQLLDLSGSEVDHEIDQALDTILGPNLSYPPPPPSDQEK
jgi:hypothetical protein